MKKSITTLVILAAAVLAATSQLAISEQDAAPAARPVPPMIQEIRSVLARSDAAVLVLQRDLDAVTDEEQALDILRAIDRQKQEAEISVLRIQERYARQDGNNEAAARIARTIEKILNPDPVTPNEEARAAREARSTGGRSHD